MMLPVNFFGLSGILFGLLAMIYGTRSIKPILGSTSQLTVETNGNVTSIRKRGWKMAIIGGLFTLWGVLFMVLAIYNLVILRGTPDATTGIVEQVLCFLPGMLVGVPLLLTGSRMIIFGEET
jgi:hypothetical protein